MCLSEKDCMLVLIQQYTAQHRSIRFLT